MKSEDRSLKKKSKKILSLSAVLSMTLLLAACSTVLVFGITTLSIIFRNLLFGSQSTLVVMGWGLLSLRLLSGLSYYH